MRELEGVELPWTLIGKIMAVVVTQCGADIRVAWLVYVRTYCVPIATLNQNKQTRLLYLGDAQIIIRSWSSDWRT